MIEIHLLHFALGVILFLIINWIGKHSYSIGYMQISMFLKVEEAPAFNFLFRVISPIVYLFIVSAILYKIGIDRFVLNIYFVSIYYILFRLIFNLLTNRGLLMNWYRQFLYWISIITISYFSYTEIIYKKENILPDFETVSNELWIIILIFLFHTINQIRISSNKTIKRKKNYLQSRFYHFKYKYGELVNERITNVKLKSIIYALMIYEDFNRPKAARIIENARFKLTGKKHSLGIMQIQTTEYINDKKSVELGIEKIINFYNKLLKEEYHRGHSEWELQYEIIKNYNPDLSYIYEVTELSDNIFDDFFSEPKNYLTPFYKEEKKSFSELQEEE